MATTTANFVNRYADDFAVRDHKTSCIAGCLIADDYGRMLCIGADETHAPTTLLRNYWAQSHYAAIFQTRHGV